MKYYIISGEASGDLHASNLIREIKIKDSKAVFRCWGGEMMEAQGVQLVKHYRDLAYMGFTEVILNIRTIINNIKFCKKDILEFSPDALILVDYPGFNLRIAKFAHEAGLKVFYYISPQVWAWKEARVHKIKKYVNHMMVILPFEADFYKKYNYHVDFVGHPLFDAINFDDQPSNFKLMNDIDDRPVIAILPGSRKQEISKMLPVMLSTISFFKDYQFLIAGMKSNSEDFYKSFSDNPKVKIVYDNPYGLLRMADAALVTSGTATLETALFDVPQVVCYKGSAISFWIAKKLVNIKYISLVNIICNKLIVKELIQRDFTVDNLKNELSLLLNDNKIIEGMKSDYRIMKEKMGGKGASAKAAEIVYSNCKIK